MKRREFIAKTAATAAGAIAAPYLLPSGRLFAQSGTRSAQHVVLVMFAGGVRHQEAVGMRYLDDAQQGAPYAGNIMNNMLIGAAPDQMIVYGAGPGGATPIPTILSQTLQQQGTLFNEVRALSAGHYGGLNSILQGADVSSQGLKMRPVAPTIFEYLRRHGGYSASDIWFVGNSIDGSLPLLNYSGHPDYGMKYGANFFAPYTTFYSQQGREQFGNMKVYHPENELGPMYRLKAFLDNNFSQNQAFLNALGNTEEEKQNIKAFMNNMYEKTNAGTIVRPPVLDNADTLCVSYAAELLSWFKPSFTCVNLSAVDQCHTDFTGYLSSLHRADHAVGWLWDYIQTQIPEMANNTVIIAIPECGRNNEPNAVSDSNGWLAYDHSDENAYRIFSLMAGPGIPQNLVIGSETNPIGSVTDAMLTVADILGVKQDLANAGFLYADTLSFLDRI
jgi:hypothetical protein